MASRIRLGAPVLALVLMSATGVPGASSDVGVAPANHPETVYAWGWMTVRNPSTPANVPQNPAPNDTGQLSGSGSGTYRHLNNTGQYRVTYPGAVPDLGPGNPVALVTAMGLNRSMCSVRSVTDIAADYVVRIHCYSSAGAPRDTRFSTSLLMASGTPTYAPPKAAAYVLANDPTNGSYTPNVQYNSTHGSGSGPFNTVNRTNVGKYKVHLPALASSGGNVQVSVYGTLAGYCRVVTWGIGNPTSETEVSVICRAPNGARKDLMFTLLYTKKVGLNLGGSVGKTAYVYSSMPNPSPNPYTPPGSINWRSYPGSTDIKKLATGRYRVYLNGINGNRGAAQVTPSLGGASTCSLGGIASIGPTQSVDVRCHNTTGALANSTFTVSYIR